MGVVVVAVVCVMWRSRRCSSRAGHRAQTSADRSADASAMTSARNGTDYRPGAGAEQAAGNGALMPLRLCCAVLRSQRRSH